MKIAAMIIGIITGLGLMLWALVGGAIGDMVTASGQAGGATIKILSFGIAIAALVGAGMVMSKPVIGGGMMAASAIVLFLWLGVGNFSLYLGLPLLIAGGLGLMASREQVAAST